MGTTPVNSDSSSAQVANQLNGVARDIQSLQTTQVFKDDTGTRRVLLGKGANDFYGLKVSEAGTDVYDAADSDLIFNSDQNVFKIIQKGGTTIPSFVSTSGYSSVTIAHGLSFTPIVLAYVYGYIVDGSLSVTSSSYIPLPVMYNTAATGPLAACYYFPNTAGSSYRPLGINFAVNSTNIIIQAGCDTTAGAFTFEDVPVTYYVLQETAT